MSRKWMTLGTLYFLPLAAFAQDGQARGVDYHFLTDCLPLIIFLGLFWALFRFTMKKNRPYQQRAIEHMDRMEQKYDRIIELLAKLTEKSNPKPPPPPSSQSNQ